MNDEPRTRPRGRTRERTRTSPSAGSRVPGALARLAVVLRTPAGAQQPLFAQAPKRWQRATPFVVVGIFVVTLLPVTIAVLSNDYGAGGGWAGALGVAQTVPLLLAVTRPLQAWVVVLAADTVAAVLLIGADKVAGHSWPWPPMTIVGYLVLMACLGLRESVRTLVGVWLVTGVVGTVLGFSQPAGVMNTTALLFVLSGVVLVLTGALRGSVTRSSGSPSRRASARRSGPGGPCWRNGPGSHGSCTTWWPTTCR